MTLFILLIVATINAVNFIDGLDGLAAGIVAVAALGFLVYSYSLVKNLNSPSQSLPAVSSALLAGMCIGFLPHNFYPARIFMGDIGAMLLGLLLAYGPISSTSSLDDATLVNYAAPNHPLNRFGTFLPLLVPAAIFLIPYTDLMLAVIRRIWRRVPIMGADREHLHHRLLSVGHSYRQSVLIMWLWAALLSATVVALSLVRTNLWLLAVATVLGVLLLLLVTMPTLRPWRRCSSAKPLGLRVCRRLGCRMGLPSGFWSLRAGSSGLPRQVAEAGVPANAPAGPMLGVLTLGVVMLGVLMLGVARWIARGSRRPAHSPGRRLPIAAPCPPARPTGLTTRLTGSPVRRMGSPAARWMASAARHLDVRASLTACRAELTVCRAELTAGRANPTDPTGWRVGAVQ